MSTPEKSRQFSLTADERKRFANVRDLFLPLPKDDVRGKGKGRKGTLMRSIHEYIQPRDSGIPYILYEGNNADTVSAAYYRLLDVAMGLGNLKASKG